MASLNEQVQKKEGGEKLSLINFIDHTIREIKYGEVKLTIHDSKVVQVESSEKFRFF